MSDKELIEKLRNNEDINLDDIINNSIFYDEYDKEQVNWGKLGFELLNAYKQKIPKKQLKLYNVQFMIEKYARLINKFVYAYDETNAKELVFNHYKNFEFNKDDVYCQKVDIKEGMILNQ